MKKANGTRSGEVIISVRGLDVGFGDHLVLNHLDLDVYRGEVLGVVGASGSGKSVLLRSIVGLLPRRAGTVSVFGKDVRAQSEEQRILIERRWGVLFQDGALFSSLTVSQNIQVPMREHLKLPQKMMDELAALKIAMVGLLGTVEFDARDLDRRVADQARSDIPDQCSQALLVFA